MKDINEFILNLRQHLLPELDNHQKQSVSNEGYVDLAKMDFVKSDHDLHLKGYPETKPITAVFEMVLNEINNSRLDRIQLAINELLKYYLVCPGNANNSTCSDVTYRIVLIFKRCLMPDFPFGKEIWAYLTRGLQNFCLCLLSKQQYKDAELALETLASLGRMAAQAGLPTAETQSAMRLIELRAFEIGQENLALQAKNHRFNLEM